MQGHIASSQNVTLNGRWRGYVLENRMSTLVEVNLLYKQNVLQGTLTVMTETGSDVKKGAVFELLQINFDNKTLTFILPVAGGINDDAIVFNLRIKGDRLTGYGHELREGSPFLPVSLIKKE
jgi:hypothetical protein